MVNLFALIQFEVCSLSDNTVAKVCGKKQDFKEMEGLLGPLAPSSQIPRRELIIFLWGGGGCSGNLLLCKLNKSQLKLFRSNYVLCLFLLKPSKENICLF